MTGPPTPRIQPLQNRETIRGIRSPAPPRICNQEGPLPRTKPTAFPWELLSMVPRNGGLTCPKVVFNVLLRQKGLGSHLFRWVLWPWVCRARGGCTCSQGLGFPLENEEGNAPLGDTNEVPAFFLLGCPAGDSNHSRGGGVRGTVPGGGGQCCALCAARTGYPPHRSGTNERARHTAACDSNTAAVVGMGQAEVRSGVVWNVSDLLLKTLEHCFVDLHQRREGAGSLLICVPPFPLGLCSTS